MQKTVLYAVLNWGLGHATRSVPIIKHLADSGQYRIVICSDGDALTLLQKEFPTLLFEKTPTYHIKYTENETGFFTHFSKQIPSLLHTIYAEHKLCKSLCKKYNVTHIISDNRYGFYTANIPNAFICHQLQLLFPFLQIAEKAINFSYRFFLKKFTQIWIPDIASPNNISGKMSAVNFKNIHYLGIDSRLNILPKTDNFNVLALLSGPEPQRSIVEQKIYTQLQNIEGKHVIVQGTVKGNALRATPNIEIVNLATTASLNQLTSNATVVLCRSGYTSIIDLIKLQKKAILIPTPSQPEQEYLAKKVLKNKWFYSTSQNKFNLVEAIELSQNFNPPNILCRYNFSVVDTFLNSPLY